MHTADVGYYIADAAAGGEVGANADEAVAGDGDANAVSKAG
jgi:hypothetical protein